MNRIVRALTLMAAALPLAAGAATDAAADGDPAFLTVGAGWYDFNKQDDNGAEFRLEYRSDAEVLGLSQITT